MNPLTWRSNIETRCGGVQSQITGKRLNSSASAYRTSSEHDNTVNTRVARAKENVSSMLHSNSFLGGEFKSGGSEKMFDVRYPYDGHIFHTLQQASLDDVRSAVSLGVDAQKPWKMKSIDTRCSSLRRLADLIREQRESLSFLITLETGKPLLQSRAEVHYAASMFDWCSQPVLLRQGTSVISHSRNGISTVSVHPVGLVLAVTPWNLPLAMLARKAAGALAAGCAVIAKPSERTPLSALALAALAKKAGIPSGVLNVIVSEDGEGVTKAALETGMVRKVSFTGSTKVGRKIGASAVENGARPLLELGGNAPVIVNDDAQISSAIQAIISNKLRMSGQTCVAANRIFVHSNIHDAFVEGVTKRVEKLTIGCGLDEVVRADLGPVIDEAAASRIEGVVADAAQNGATITTGGKANGAIMSATVLSGVKDDMKVSRNEVFGPVWSILSFDEVDEVLERANDTGAGLAAYVFSRKSDVVQQLCEGLQFGLVGVNDTSVGKPEAPFGGGKDSGMGREGGTDAVRAFMEERFCTMAT